MFSGLYRRVRMRVAYQRDLARTIERFQSAAEAIPDGMVVLDTANRIKWANVRARACTWDSMTGTMSARR